MTCTNCHGTIPAGSNQCSDCGQFMLRRAPLAHRRSNMNCDRCGNHLPSGANFCPDCGNDVSEMKPGFMSESIARPIGFLIGTIFVIGLPLMCMSAFSTNPTSQPSTKKIGAYAACQQFVTQRLKAPSTADFPSFDSKSVTTGANVFTVDSYVDAQNAFGAKIRTRFSCNVLSEDGENWKLTSLRLDK